MNNYAKDIGEPEGGWRDVASFTNNEKRLYRPIAETLAMLDGNAFFGGIYSDKDCEKREWYEMYLPEAAALVDNNGGFDGWAGEVSFLK